MSPAKGVGPAEQVLARLHSKLARDSSVAHGYAVSAAADAAQVVEKKYSRKKNYFSSLGMLVMERR
jgi:hypothetical protein